MYIWGGWSKLYQVVTIVPVENIQSPMYLHEVDSIGSWLPEWHSRLLNFIPSNNLSLQFAYPCTLRIAKRKGNFSGETTIYGDAVFSCDAFDHEVVVEGEDPKRTVICSKPSDALKVAKPFLNQLLIQ